MLERPQLRPQYSLFLYRDQVMITSILSADEITEKESTLILCSWVSYFAYGCICMASFQLIMLLIVLHHACTRSFERFSACFALEFFSAVLIFYLSLSQHTCRCTLFMSFCRCFICYILLGDIERSTFKMRG